MKKKKTYSVPLFKPDIIFPECTFTAEISSEGGVRCVCVTCSSDLKWKQEMWPHVSVFYQSLTDWPPEAPQLHVKPKRPSCASSVQMVPFFFTGWHWSLICLVEHELCMDLWNTKNTDPNPNPNPYVDILLLYLPLILKSGSSILTINVTFQNHKCVVMTVVDKYPRMHFMQTEADGKRKKNLL